MEVPLPATDTSKALVQDVYDRAAAVGVQVDGLEDLADTDGLFSRVIKFAPSFVIESATPDPNFIDALQSFGAELSRRNKDLGAHYTALASMSRDINLARQRYNSSVTTLVQSHLGTTIVGTSPFELKSNFEKSVRHYEKERSKKTSKSFSERKQAALETQQRVLQNAAVDYVMHMQAV